MLETKKKRQQTLQVVDLVRKPVAPGTKRRGPRPLRGSEWGLPPVLVDILNTGLRRLQSLDNPARCAIEAEHLQSLPALLVDFDPEVFEKYVNVDRLAFIAKSSRKEIADFEPAWARLAEIVQACKDERAAG
ncbi:MAG: hypothetical protein HYX68_02965 [Planctomycetes bacterium]|nr:hypothetical protein [Planctomycetota bacterium]